MSERDLRQELIFLFDAAGDTIEQEMRIDRFERLQQGLERLEDRAAESVRAAYVTIEPGLRVAGIVFFLVPFDAHGAIPDSFNLPLDYLAEFAGERADLGIGPVRAASRAQCPVPWMALKLWEPDARPDGPARAIQRTVLLNRLGLNSHPAAMAAAAAAPMPAVGRPVSSSRSAAPAAVTPPVRPAATTTMRGDAALAVAAPAARANQALAFEPVVAQPAPEPQRDALGMIDPAYLEQIRRLRAEVLELKGALRRERERNRRLQELLRGQF